MAPPVPSNSHLDSLPPTCVKAGELDTSSILVRKGDAALAQVLNQMWKGGLLLLVPVDNFLSAKQLWGSLNKSSFDIGKLSNTRVDICGLEIPSCTYCPACIAGWHLFTKGGERGLDKGQIIH